MSGLYFLHIPRTSGTEICSRIVSTILSDGSRGEIALLGSNEFINEKYGPTFEEPQAVLRGIDPSKKMFLFGHFATNPIYGFPSLSTFSIIRHPVDRLESVANYLLNSADYLTKGLHREIETHLDFERFFTSNELAWYGNSYPGFNCATNMQSAYLTGIIASSRIDYRPESQSRGMAFNIVGAAENIEDVVGQIREKRITISTIENRMQLIKELHNQIVDKLNINIFTPDNKQFYTKQVKKFSFSDRTRSKIIEENELDFKLYNLVREHERRNGSLFS